jgi:translation initiation factor IF-3
VTHPERGTAILDRLAGELSELAVIEQHPTQDGRNMTMLLAPSRSVLAGHLDQPRPNGAGQDGPARPVAPAEPADAAAAAPAPAEASVQPPASPENASEPAA